MKSTLRFFTAACLSLCLNIAAVPSSKCPCHRPKPQPIIVPIVAPTSDGTSQDIQNSNAPEKMVKTLESICCNFLSDLTFAMYDSKCPCNRPRPRMKNNAVMCECCERLAQESPQTSAMCDAKCPCNRPRPRMENDEVVYECCERISQDSHQTSAMNDSKCPCHRPRPRMQNDEVKMLLRECCQMLLQEAQQTSDSELEEKVLNAMRCMQHMEVNKKAHCCNERRTNMETEENAKNSELLLTIAQNQQANNDQMVKLLNSVLRAVQQRCNN